jgi:hypothetical protein
VEILGLLEQIVTQQGTGCGKHPSQAFHRIEGFRKEELKQCSTRRINFRYERGIDRFDHGYADQWTSDTETAIEARYSFRDGRYGQAGT